MLATLGEWATQPTMVLVFLLSIRLSALFMLTPVLFAVPIPPTVRVLLILSLSVALALGQAGAQVPPELPALANDAVALMMAVLTEAALGATLALGILLAFAAFSFAGTLLDIQIGFGMAWQNGGAQQTMIVNLGLFNEPVLVGQIVVKPERGK